jgi:hypothetical protein
MNAGGDFNLQMQIILIYNKQTNQTNCQTPNIRAHVVLVAMVAVDTLGLQDRMKEYIFVKKQIFLKKLLLYSKTSAEFYKKYLCKNVS